MKKRYTDEQIIRAIKEHEAKAVEKYLATHDRLTTFLSNSGTCYAAAQGLVWPELT